MTQIGPLPLTGKIEPLFEESQAEMLDKGLISNFRMDAIISSPDRPSESKKIIKLVIEFAHRPGSFYSKTKFHNGVSNAFNESTMNGLSRAEIYLLDNLIMKNSWILFGRIEGRHLDIIIIFHKETGIGTYSFKKDEEKIEDFNPQLN